MCLSNLLIILVCFNFAYKRVITFESREPNNAHVCVDNISINSISASSKMNLKGAVLKTCSKYLLLQCPAVLQLINTQVS